MSKEYLKVAIYKESVAEGIASSKLLTSLELEHIDNLNALMLKLLELDQQEKYVALTPEKKQ